MGFISRYVREQKRYTKNEIKSIFSFSESEAESFIRRLKSFGIMKAVKNTAGQRDLSDLSDADIEIADDTGESSECFYVFTYVGVLTIGDRVVKCFPKYIRFLYKGIIIKHNKTEPTYTKTSLFLCEKRRFFMARTEKGVVATI